MPIQSVPITLSLALGLLIGVGACSDDEPEPDYQPTIAIEINPDVDFSAYMTFDVVDPTLTTDDVPPDKFVEVQTQLEDAIVAELSARGLTHVQDAPDLLVNPLVSASQVQDEAQFYEAYYGYYWGYEYLWTVDVDYAVGSLLIDVIDEDNDVLVYRGVAEGLLSEDIDVIKLQIRNAVHAIFDDWPRQ